MLGEGVCERGLGEGWGEGVCERGLGEGWGDGVYKKRVGRVREQGVGRGVCVGVCVSGACMIAVKCDCHAVILTRYSRLGVQ